MPVLATEMGAQSKSTLSPSQELFNKIASLDSSLFDAYNGCDLKKFESFFSDDLEFYHDKDGLINSRKSLVDSIKTNICGQVRREIVAGTLEVYPIPGYGAIEAGSHRFYQRQKGKTEKAGGAAKFLMVWQNKGGEWKITRVISYAH